MFSPYPRCIDDTEPVLAKKSGAGSSRMTATEYNMGSDSLEQRMKSP